MTSEEIFGALSGFNHALAEGEGADAQWKALQALTQRVVGAKLFTVMKTDVEANVASRLYTNMPDAYPVSGTKPISLTPWFEQVVLGRQTFVMNTIGEIATHFSDHELIASLGCGSCVNMPVVVKGRVLGTVNMLDAEQHFTPERVARVEHLRVPAMAAFLV